MLVQDFYFAEFEVGKPVEALRVGDFVDRFGRPVRVTEEDLDRLVENFEAGEAGQEIPIDINHTKAEAGGWVKRIWREGQVLLAEVEWNEVGRNLVIGKVYRYLSATFQPISRLLKSISLVNFPAVKGLKPVELSEGGYTMGAKNLLGRLLMSGMRMVFGAELADGEPGTVSISGYLQARIHRTVSGVADDMAATGWLSVDERKEISAALGAALELFAAQIGDAGERLIPVDVPLFFGEGQEGKSNQEVTQMGKEYTEQELADLRAQAKAEGKAEAVAELQENAQADAELREQIRGEVRGEVETEVRAQIAREVELKAFADEVCEAGLSETPDEVVAFLAAQPEDQLEKAKQLLKSRVVDFSEVGSSARGQGDRGELSAEIKPMLREFVESGRSVAEFFELNADELGEADQYDLTEFKEKDE